MNNKRFKIKLKQYLRGSAITVIVDKETGVNYIVTIGFGFSGVTPLLDNNGEVIIDKL